MLRLTRVPEEVQEGEKRKITREKNQLLKSKTKKSPQISAILRFGP